MSLCMRVAEEATKRAETTSSAGTHPRVTSSSHLAITAGKQLLMAGLELCADTQNQPP